ncbi:holin [Paenibacillus psychroresistens]|uniref:Holin n=1 Tax=Paenibacillus psychroresistens TaxID=1778678 RepID=A0A6B8RI05_9BACL|nr:phage holin family protein [Paenibacillus psychroresistens]QGQ95880.1 holin [Paenibacillus psychroresistens]
MDRYLKSILSLDTLLKYKNVATGAVGAAAAPFLEQAFSSGKFWCYLFLFLIIIGDWISGSAAARKDGTYSSEYGISGVLRTTLILLIPFIGFALDMISVHVFKISQPGCVYYALTLMLARHSAESLTANSARAGWDRWIPNKVLIYISSEIQAKIERSEKQKGGGK